MHARSVVLLLLLLHDRLLSVASVEIVDDYVVEADGSSFHLMVTPPVVPESVEERLEHYRAMEAKDLLRHRQIISNNNGDGGTGGERRRRRHLVVARESSMTKLPEEMSSTSMFELPMRSAINIAHVGMYLVLVRFGTPAMPYNLALDTATDLTWINCRLRRRRGKHYGRPHVQRSPTVNVLSFDGETSKPVKVMKNWYRPARSSSWRRIRCSQQECAELPYNQCESVNQTVSCSYYQVVQDGTTTSGIYGKEKATVALSGGRLAKLPGLILGCSTFEAGGSVDSHDGVLALGNSGISFGVHAAKRFSGRFSFCLNSGGSSYLTFGNNPALNKTNEFMMAETPLKYHPDMVVAYGVRVTSITVAGELLDIPPEVWDDAIVGAGMVLDTGTSLTGLAPPAYTAVTRALHRRLAHLQRVTDIAGFDFCYTNNNYKFIPNFNFTIELEGGARLEPEAKSVVMPEVVPGVACLPFRKLDMGPGIIGNVLMQDHLWEFDLITDKIRFKKDKCTDHHV
ncbi:hypothetical protein PR202_gb09660 [Eleusine coracana subsp. coracana]|uniref:Peptidase A1 domain-containing protein n=1 Tax=Eleusine coracana subsp. coracana TaxID=191504 RepID=A0AAV5EFI7_ELECO|nr:hypothetical protein QOZ80_5BG0409180 [Eleusine coracana subsp. coracana]GJN22124.1 hypothetical protein PR202_gb09660 [Eleusine coracana subsp. coracana]